VIITLLALLEIARLLPMSRIVDVLGAVVQDMGIWDPLMFALVYVVATVLMLPGAALTLAAGAIFGLVWGTVAVSIGSTTGAALAFLIGRYLARDTVERRLGRVPRGVNGYQTERAGFDSANLHQFHGIDLVGRKCLYVKALMFRDSFPFVSLLSAFVTAHLGHI